jgi:hypothetical protein
LRDIEALCAKEKKRVEEALAAMRVLDSSADDVIGLVHSYRTDAEHFASKQRFLEAFELYVYIFGMLDALARMKVIDPGDAKHHFKVEQ